MSVSAQYLPFSAVLTLQIDDDGAQYIAEVMHEEFGRSGDRGAYDIATSIEDAMKRKTA